MAARRVNSFAGAVITCSNRSAAGQRPDDSGDILAELLIQSGCRIVARVVVAAGLALYDMVKAVDRTAVLSDVRLLAKSGGRSGSWRREG